MIQIREIYKKKDIKKFVEFPNILYKDCPYFVPNMFGDEVNMFNPKEKSCLWILWNEIIFSIQKQ